MRQGLHVHHTCYLVTKVRITDNHVQWYSDWFIKSHLMFLIALEVNCNTEILQLSLQCTKRIGQSKECFPWWVNPLSTNSDQQQFSPHNIHTLSRDKVMRINKMITKEKMLWSFIKFSQLIVKGDVWRSVWRICMWILGLNDVFLFTFY